MILTEKSISWLDSLIRALLFVYALTFPISFAAGNFCIDAALILGAVRVFCQRTDLQMDRKIISVICLYGLMLLCSAIRADHLNAGFHQAYTAIYYMLPPFLLAQLFILPQRRLYYLGLMLLAILASALYAYFQALHGFYRPAGFIDRLELAGNITQMLPVLTLLLCETASPKNNLRIRLMSAAAILLFTAALILNGTRGAWLAIGLTLLLYLLHYILTARKSYMLVSIFLCVLVLSAGALSVLPETRERMLSIASPTDYSKVTRFAMWDSASRMFADHPLIGVGLGNYYDLYRNQYFDPVPWEKAGNGPDGLTHKHPHNIFLYLLAETGVVGFSSFLLLIGVVFRHFYSLLQTGSQLSQFFAKMALLLLLSYLSFGLTENLIFGMYPAMQSLWFMLGMLWFPCEKPGRR